MRHNSIRDGGNLNAIIIILGVSISLYGFSMYIRDVVRDITVAVGKAGSDTFHLVGRIDTKIKVLDNKIDTLVERMDSFDAQMDALDGKIEELHAATIDAKMNRIIKVLQPKKNPGPKCKIGSPNWEDDCRK